MICYRLRCDDSHEFEGWFQDSAGFDEQSLRGLLSCPICGSASVGQALMAPAVRTSPARDEPPAVPPTIGSMTPDTLRTVLARVREVVERECEDVGDRFAEEALKINRGESDVRGIYGSATEAEREVLEDEGVEFSSLPWLPRMDS